MNKKKNYLVYDADDAPEETGTLRERLEKENTEANENTEVAKTTKTAKEPKKTKKVIERVLMALIAIIMTSIAALLGVYMLNGEDAIINGPDEQIGRIDVSPNTSGMTARKMFTIVSNNNAVIVDYFDDVVVLLKSDNQNYKETLALYKKQISADLKTFSYYSNLYKKYQGIGLYDVYTERLMNVLDLIEYTYSASDKSRAIAAANECIKTEQVLNARSIGALLEWLNVNEIPYIKEGSAIILK